MCAGPESVTWSPKVHRTRAVCTELAQAFTQVHSKTHELACLLCDRSNCENTTYLGLLLLPEV